ncbi:recombinase family protein [Prauserella cavernicola]|uniref:Recombinase family protein n=1 Tax=Prauserella cavernicola TaxID=2800127 RepID=A0A934QRT7_9PSEU|nr:recombinase family protein [Prauserella cavernicola]MBK1785102.1 recombinase family protein [Prauserella cavernicola]
MTVTAAIYCRLSWAPDGSLENVDRQELDARALAQRNGWRVSENHIYKDNSVSAWQRNRKRRGWDAMLEAIKNNQVNGIIVYHGDRLVRQPWDLELLLRLADERRLQLASVSGVRDLNSPDDRFVLRIEAAQACKASDDTSRRVKHAWERRAEKGLPAGGGRRPFGFEADKVTHRPDEAVLVEEAAERLVAGQTIAGVVAWLNERSTTSMGNRWDPRAMQNVLLAPRVVGLIQRQGQTYEGAWAPIISVELWEEVKALFARNAKLFPYQGRARRYLLTGVAECYNCGSTLSSKPTGGRNRKTSRIYYCRQCKRAGRNTEHLDEYVVTQVLAVLNRPRFKERLAEAANADPKVGKEIAQLERRREAAKKQLEQLVDHPDIDPALIAKSLAAFSAKIDDLRSQQSLSTRHRLLLRAAGMDRAGWDALPLDLRAEVIRALFRVVVLPATWRGPGFDPDSVKLIRVPG